MALLVSHVVLALVLGPAREGLDALPVLVIVPPIAFVASLLLRGINPEAVGFVVHPIAIVNVTTGMVEFPSAACLVVLPGAFVSPRIWP